jgi:hypothetical protein
MTAVGITLFQEGNKLIVKQDTSNKKPIDSQDLEDNSYFWAALIGQRANQINSNRKGIGILTKKGNKISIDKNVDLKGTNLMRAIEKEMHEVGVYVNNDPEPIYMNF